MRIKAIMIATLALLTIALAAAPTASAGPEPQCMPVYQEHHLGPVTIIRKDSCSAEVRFNGLHPCEWEPAVC